jgi:hypothetical protein
MAGYDGPVVDAFLHTPWLGGDDRADPRDDVDWHRPPLGARHAPQRNMASSPARRKELVAQENSYQQVGIEHIVGGL